MFRNVSFLLTCLLLIQASLIGQAPIRWHFSEEEGLPGTKVFSIFQDSKGYIWIGTNIGLVRYDGYEFREYTHPVQKGLDLTRIQEDPGGRVWAHSFGGQIFYVESDTLRFFEPWEEFRKGIEFERIEIDSENRIWILGKKVHIPHIYDFHTQTWSILEVPDKRMKFRWMIEHTPGRYILSSEDKIWMIQDGKLEELRLPFQQELARLPGISKTAYGDIFFYDKDQVNQGFYLFHEPGKFTHINLPGQQRLFQTRYTTVRGTSQKDYFFLTGDGAYVYDSTFTPYLNGKPLLKGMQTTGFLHDSEGNIWIGTKRSGIFVFPGLGNVFYDQDNSALPDIRISKLEQTNEGRLLVGYQNGTGTIYDPAADKGIPFFVDPGKTREIKALFHDPERAWIWVTGANDLIAFDMNGQKMLEGRRGGGDDVTVYRNHLYRATPYFSDVHALNPEFGTAPPLTPTYRNNFLYYTPPDSPFQSLTFRPNRSYSILGDATADRIWIGYFDGLIYYEDAKEHEVRLADSSSILAFNLSQTSDGTIWAGTPSQGVIGIKDGKVIHHFSTDNKLISNKCRWLKTDGNEVWVGTDVGVFLIDPEKEEVWVYGKQDALPSNEIRGLAILDEWIYISTPKGLIRFQKDEIRSDVSQYPTYINNIALFERDTSLMQGVTLTYDQNNLRFGFVGLAYRAQKNFQYRYRMLGLDSSWVSIPSSQRFARFPSLPSGSYTFEVQTFVEGAQRDQIPARFSFSIGEPYWRSWWFWTLVVAGLLGIISLGFQYRINLIKERNQIDRQLRIAQLSAIKSQMNPHFIFNALNSIQDFILLNEKRQANSFLGKFSDLMRLYLDMSSEMSVKLSSILRALELYLQLEGIRFGESFNYILDVHESIDPETISIPSMVIQPYVENAIKHGLLHKRENRLLLIRFELLDQGKVLHCEIRDNGVGRKRAEEIKARNPMKRKSFSTVANKKRLDLLNYGQKHTIGVDIVDLYSPTGQAEGTQVNIQIPIPAIHPTDV